MKLKKWYWLVFLIVAMLLHWFAMPDVILNDHSGGSCYQGITRGITHFLFVVCIFFALISFLLLLGNKRSFSILTGLTSAGIWILWSFVLISEYHGYGFLYAAPFLLYIASYLYALFSNKVL
ncbi:hypothetical protein [Flavobacterium sp. GCM10027622]|uniref:hypothetical protein n=1 Tax=unclassified Flavobacterium TaxID=196869 RepID=UPI00360BDF2D